MGWTTSEIQNDQITGTLFSDASGGQPATITVLKNLQGRVTSLGPSGVVLLGRRIVLSLQVRHRG